MKILKKILIALGIIIAVLLPLGRIVPPLYEFRIRSRVFLWYGQLRDIEERMGASSAGAPPGAGAALVRELDDLEARVEKIAVPLSHTDELYALRNHIDLVRQRLLRA